jgi:hypothetical protein
MRPASVISLTRRSAPPCRADAPLAAGAAQFQCFRPFGRAGDGRPCRLLAPTLHWDLSGRREIATFTPLIVSRRNGKPTLGYEACATAQGPMFELGFRWVVVGPGGAILGYYLTDADARARADVLNASASRRKRRRRATTLRPC